VGSVIVRAVTTFVMSNRVLVAFLGGNVTGSGATILAPKMKRLIKYKLTGKWK
jgi:hypothetical protein